MLITGRFTRTIDDKQRVAIPKPIRETLENVGKPCLYLLPGTDSAIAGYTEEGMERLSEKLREHSPVNRDVRSYTRMLYARTHRVGLDKQGRIRIPDELATLAGIVSDIMLIGVGDHLELWSPSAWQKFYEEAEPKYDKLAETALGAT